MYVDPGINTSASNLKWVLPYCKPDLPRVVGALLLFIANNTMALTIPILSGIIVRKGKSLFAYAMTGCEKVNLDGHAIEFLRHAVEHMNLLRIGNAKRIILISEQRK